ncbi:hypothetical protein EAE93_19655 [Photorhabdus akhurstii]|nr:hypothetical protein [Photorhabdus akhurstii]
MVRIANSLTNHIGLSLVQSLKSPTDIEATSKN